MNRLRISVGLIFWVACLGVASPLYSDSTQAGGVEWADSALVTVNLADFGRYTLRSDPVGWLSESSKVVLPGSVIVTPDLADNPYFGYWTLDGVRQEDAWGVAYTRLSFVVNLTDRIAVAQFFASDVDADGVLDAYEYRYYGTLAQGAASDTDGDGVLLFDEYMSGTSPVFGNSAQEGGVVWADSATVTVNFEHYSRYTLRSEPEGTVSQTAVVAPGAEVVTPDLSANDDFGYWTLDGMRQEDAWGVAYAQISFTVEESDREAVAFIFSGDSDADGVPDAYEQRYFGTLSYGAGSDSDADGLTLLEEYTGGSHPLYADSNQAGGVAWADSELVGIAHQPEIGIEQPSGTLFTDGGSRDFGSIQVGNSSSLTFTVRNHGGSELTGLTLTKTGTDAAEFSVISYPTAPLLHNGSTTFTIRFSPVSAGAKSAVFQLASNDADESPFDLNLTGTGVVTAGYTSWRQGCFSSEALADPLISGSSADPDGDGLSNLIEYALGLEPMSTDTTGLPEMSTTSTDWVYTYSRPADRDDITYEVEVSTNLDSWSTSGVTHTQVSTEGDAETWQATYSLSSATNLFFRLKIVK